MKNKTKSEHRNFTCNLGWLKFTIHDDCTGEVTVLKGHSHVFSSDFGTHEDKINLLRRRAKELKIEANLLDKAATYMSKFEGTLCANRRY